MSRANKRHYRKLPAAEVEDVMWWKANTDLSDQRIGERFAISQSTVAKILRGEYRPREQYKKPK